MVQSMSRMTVAPLAGSGGGSGGSGVVLPAPSPQAAGGEDEGVVDLSTATISRLEAKVAEMRGLKVG